MTLRNKLIAAGSLLAVLGLVGAVQAGLSVAQLARLVLGLAALAILSWWFIRARQSGTFKQTPRLAVVQRAGLSQRNGVALIEVDGRPFIVVHGDGFARIRAVPKRVRLTLAEPTPAVQEIAQ